MKAKGGEGEGKEGRPCPLPRPSAVLRCPAAVRRRPTVSGGVLRSVARYHGTTAVLFFYGTSTVAFTVLFSTAIPQVPRFFGTVLVQ